MRVIDYLRHLREIGELNTIISIGQLTSTMLSIKPKILERMEWYDFYEKELQRGNKQAWSETILRFKDCYRNELSRSKTFFEQEMVETDWINTCHAKLSWQVEEKERRKSRIYK